MRGGLYLKCEWREAMREKARNTRIAAEREAEFEFRIRRWRTDHPDSSPWDYLKAMRQINAELTQ